MTSGCRSTTSGAHGGLRQRPALVMSTLLAVLSACVPFPHRVVQRPALTGTVSQAGVLLPGVTVSVLRGSDALCTAGTTQIAPEETHQSTDATGAFQFAPFGQLKLFYAPLVAPLSVSTFTVCITAASQQWLGYRGLIRIHSDDPASLNITCDIARPYQVRNMYNLTESLVCRVANDPVK